MAGKETEMSTALVPVADLDRMAQAVADSKLFGVTNKEQALALMLVAQAEGLHPATAARDYHIIQGRPTLKSDAMLGRYLSSGGKVEWHEHTDEKVSATFTHPAGGSLRIDWDMARAQKAGIKNPMWQKYPRQMLRARVISEGVRATNPNVAVGVYTPEEAGDFEPAAKKPTRGSRARDMGTAEVVDPDTGEITPQATTAQTDPDRNSVDDGMDDNLPFATDGPGDFHAELAETTNLKQFAAVWNRIPKAQRRDYAGVRKVKENEFKSEDVV